MTAKTEYPVTVTHAAVYPSGIIRLARFVRRHLALIVMSGIALTGVPQTVIVTLYEEFAAADTTERQSMVSLALFVLIGSAVFLKVVRWATKSGDSQVPDVRATYTVTTSPHQ